MERKISFTFDKTKVMSKPCTHSIVQEAMRATPKDVRKPKHNMIKLDNNYTIESDGLNLILRYKKEGEINEKTGKPKTSKGETYHATLEQALWAYIDKKVSVEVNQVDNIFDAVFDASEMISKIAELKQEVIKTVRELNL